MLVELADTEMVEPLATVLQLVLSAL